MVRLEKIPLNAAACVGTMMVGAGLATGAIHGTLIKIC